MADSKVVQQITDADFDSVLNGGKPVFVDFWAPWCGPCRIIGPIVEELAPSYDGKAVIAKLNVDDNPNVAQRFGVTSIPTLMMFKDGKLVDRMVGAAPKPALQQCVERYLSIAPDARVHQTSAGRPAFFYAVRRQSRRSGCRGGAATSAPSR
jgi:thioredoxin 1